LLAEGPDASLGTASNREITLRMSVTASAAAAARLAGEADEQVPLTWLRTCCA
jgi:hypothetical protein